jgi:acyl carrier protein
MGMANTREEIAKYIQEEFITDGDDVDLDTVDLLEEEIVDSLGIFTLVSFIEEKFGVAIDPTDINLDNFQNLDAITALVDAAK